MSLTREVAIIFGLILICSSSSQYAGKSFQLTRSDYDEFKNPTAEKCDWQAEYQNRKFCVDTNALCNNNQNTKHCCECICDWPKSTFDRRVMKCQINKEIRSECSVKFKNIWSDGHPIKLLNLKNNGKETLYWKYKNEVKGDKIKSFNVLSIASYHDGKVAMKSFLKKKGKPKKDQSGNYETEIKWDQVSLNEYYGLIFRVNISYEIEKKKNISNIKDCFVFKSSGSIKVTFPSLSSTTLSPSTTEESTSPVRSSKKTPSTTPDTKSSSTTPDTKSSNTTPDTKSSSTTPNTKSSSTTPDTKSSSTTPDTKSSSTTPDTKSSSTTPTGKTETMTTTGEQAKTVNPVHTNKMSTFESSTTSKNTASPGAREKSSGDENDTVVVSLVVVACIVFIVAVILVVWWKRRQSGRASKQNNQATIIANKGANNPMIMSPMESIYAEADNSVNYLQEKEKNSNVYDYATGNLESNYTSLDLSKVESDPVYHSLCDSHNQPGVTGQCVSRGKQPHLSRSIMLWKVLVLPSTLRKMITVKYERFREGLDTRIQREYIVYWKSVMTILRECTAC
ncbi:uncharacterized protein LOC114521742 isoform X2 [Dendronephthya gigantea]|uniref:uncharacterized protein LOC114521742 isoform X2 n=1 Tax=Dendronephthya gigantea TaxID=151771 RepID=UPI00106C610D|nr:uncharacterized protein LOC114521742 isoform X2 [Dendronephthya gigantea]